jgi:LmbE family N-acetylglucosaminyl deacetylase
MATLRLMAVLAHPDDESLGVGGTLAKYAAEGVETAVVTATRGQRGRFRGHREPPEHPGSEALGRIREAELQAAARTLGVSDVTILDYVDQALDRAEPRRIIRDIADRYRRLQPHVVLTFPPDGAYGHPDHIAISQFATAAAIEAASSPPAHAISKLYYLAWPQASWRAYEAAFRALVSTVDGVARHAAPWPDWAITTSIDARAHWQTVWNAVCCHESQVTAYEHLRSLSPEAHEGLWGEQSFYRAFSLVNGGRQRERDIFEGLR